MTKPVKVRGAVIVTRVSGHEQDKTGTSPETQLAACREKAASLGLPIVAEYYDAAISGASLLLRTGMLQAIEDIRGGRADTLVSFNIDRFSRHREHQERIKREVQSAGGRLVFCDADYADDAAGNLSFNIRGDFAVFERDHFRERSMLGKRSRAAQGVQTCRSTDPLGYHIPSKVEVWQGLYTAAEAGTYIIVEAQAPLVRRIFAGYAAGTHSLYRICQELNEEKVPTPRGGILWRPGTLRGILRNPVYKGEPIYGKVEHRMDESRLQQINPETGRRYRSRITRRRADPERWIIMQAPALVTEDVWDRSQARFAENKATKSGNPKRVRMLSGRALCPGCGGPLRYASGRQGNREYDYYTCGRHQDHLGAGAGAAECLGTHYPAAAAESQVCESLMEAAEHPNSVREQLQVYLEVNAPQPVPAKLSKENARKERLAIDTALNELAAEEATAVQAQIAGMQAGASPAAYAAVFAAIAERRKSLESQRQTLLRGEKRAALAKKTKATQAGSSKAGISAAEVSKAEVSKAGVCETGVCETGVCETGVCETGVSDTEMLRLQGLSDLHRVLTSEKVSGVDKRDLLGKVIDRVIVRKGEVEVFYVSGALEDWLGLAKNRENGEPFAGRDSFDSTDYSHFAETGQFMSTPQPRNTSVRPPPSSAPRCARVSTPDAPPETKDKPC